MAFDFSTIMVAFVAITGAIWAIDAIFLAPRRRMIVAGASGAPGASGDIDAIQTPPPSIIVEYAKSFFPVFLIVLLLRSFLIEPFRIPSNSMMPTLLTGDFIVVNKYNYGIRLPILNAKVFEIGVPKRGDVVVFRYPEDPSTPFIKRVVGVPGDHIVYRDKALYVNGEAARQTPIGTFVGVGSGQGMTGAREIGENLGDAEHRILVHPNYPTAEGEWTVPAGHYFVLGDNRDNSRDSRFWGFVPDQNLIGRAFRIWMNFDGGVDFGRIGQSIE